MISFHIEDLQSKIFVLWSKLLWFYGAYDNKLQQVNHQHQNHAKVILFHYQANIWYLNIQNKFKQSMETKYLNGKKTDKMSYLNTKKKKFSIALQLHKYNSEGLFLSGPK